MPNGTDGESPAGNSDGQPSTPRPLEPSAEKREMALEGESHTEVARDDTAKEMKREFRWVEYVTIATNVILAVVGIFALVAYYGQLKAMNGQLTVMQGQLKEMQTGQGASDTHTLAQQAVTQATQITNLATATGILAAAAGKQADASKLIADNAKVQAQATQNSATSMQTSSTTAKDAMYLEQRPWVGIEIFPASLAPNAMQTAPGQKASAVSIFAHNTGRTPALDWGSECCEYLDNERGDEPVADYDVLRSDVDGHISTTMRDRINKGEETLEQARDRIRQTQALEARATYESQVIAPGGFKEVQNITKVGGDDHKFHYILGKFVYRDVLDSTKEQTTKFCLVFLGASPVRLCKTGQDMN